MGIETIPEVYNKQNSELHIRRERRENNRYKDRSFESKRRFKDRRSCESSNSRSSEATKLEKEFVKWMKIDDDGCYTTEEDDDYAITIYITSKMSIRPKLGLSAKIKTLLNRTYAMDSSISEVEAVKNIYDEAEKYWTAASEDVDGMLGGFASLHKPDISLSKIFLRKLQEKRLLLNTRYALDCGAGIGRVTKHLLLPRFEKVDMVDVAENLISKSDKYIGPDPNMGEKFVEGLQTFTPPVGRYDLIWIQWVSGHLTDNDFVSFFERCKKGLKPGGVIVLKDNLASQETSIFDPEDHSWTRPETLVDELFAKANLKVVCRNMQTGFPKGMYKVKMFALKPV